MTKKLFPVLLILLVAFSWGNVFYRGYTIPKQYDSYICDAEQLEESELYYRAVEEYKNAYNIKASVNIYDKILDCYDIMGDEDELIQGCLNGIEIYPDYEKTYERILRYYSNKDENDFVRYAAQFKTKFPQNEIINEYYKQAAKITYVSDFMEEKPYILSQNMYMYYEEEYDYDLDESRKYAVVKDFDGRKIFSGEYKKIRIADDGYFVQDSEGKWEIVNEKGFVVQKCDKDTITDIVGKAAGYYIVIDNGKYRFMNNEMKLSENSYDYISNSSEGIYAVCKAGKWALVQDSVMNYEGEYVYDNIEINSQGQCCVNDRIVVQKNGKYEIINKKEEEILVCENELKAYEDNQPTVFKADDTFGFIYKNGNTFIKNTFQDALPYKQGIAAINVDGKWGYIDLYGNIIIQPQYEEVTSLISEGKVFVKEKDKYWQIITIPLFANT